MKCVSHSNCLYCLICTVSATDSTLTKENLSSKPDLGNSNSVSKSELDGENGAVISISG